MRTIYEIAVVSSLLMMFAGCNVENDFYEVGAQPVYLEAPPMDTSVVLDYTTPNEPVDFAWRSKRHYVEYELIFDINESFESPSVMDPGIADHWTMTHIQLDSLMASMGVGIGASSQLYWTIRLVDPENGWCDDVRRLSVTRCDFPDNEIILLTPEAEGTVVLSEDGLPVTFTWECSSPVDDYVLQLGTDPAFADETKTIECGSEKSWQFDLHEFDSWLESLGYDHDEEADIYWKVSGTGDIYSPVKGSGPRKLTVRRMVQSPVMLEYVSPKDGTELLLDAELAEETVTFDWSCDTAGVTYDLILYDAEFDRRLELEAGDKTEYSMTQNDFDLLLESSFGMVPSQVKKLQWSVLPSDTVTFTKIPVNPNVLSVRRFEAVGSAPLITLVSAPDNGSEFVLDYENGENVLAEISWECDAAGVTYAIECSLDEQMENSFVYPLSSSRVASVTAAQLDEMLTQLGKSYLTATMYWRIVSTVKTRTTPSETRSMLLTGMIRPFEDARDPAGVEIYNTVKIGDDVWMTENLRAMVYSDGTPFLSVDNVNGLPAVKTFSDDLIGDPDIRGAYYSWPIAIRDYQNATSSESEILQGVCPDGWHVSTMQEWKDAIALCGNGAADMKSDNWWTGNTGTNALGLDIVPNGSFWHGGVAAPDNPTDKACFWTPTKYDGTTAYMYELFGWSNEIVPWYYNSRPFSEGDSIASKCAAVRCVRDKN